MESRSGNPSAEESLFLTLNATCSRLQKTAEELVRTANLTVAEYTILRLVQNSPGIVAGEVKDRLYATAPSVAQLVMQVEKKGFLRRSRDAADARRRPLHITPAGAAALNAAGATIHQFLQSLSLSPGFLPSLERQLHQFLTSLSSYGNG